MIGNRVFTWGFFLILAGSWLTAEQFEPVYQLIRLTDRVVLVQSGIEYRDQVIAVNTGDGIVLIDSGKASTLAEQYRKMIVEEFGHDNFKFLISTHFHYDHTDGNQVFPEARIVAHERTPELMRGFDNQRARFVRGRRERLAQWEKEYAEVEQNSTRAQQLRDILSTVPIMLDDLEYRYRLTLPQITFSEQMSIRVGDLNFRLYYYGTGGHTGDDILVHIPEEKVLATGDLFWPEGVQFSFGPGGDVEHWLAALDAVLLEKDQVVHVVTTHSGVMSGPDLVARRDYMKSLWKMLEAGKERGATMDEMMSLSVDKPEFSCLKSLDVPPEELKAQHRENLRWFWYDVMDAQPAADRIGATIRIGSLAAARELFAAIRLDRHGRFILDENAFNGLGYSFLYRERNPEAALAVFQMNTELYPESWNTWDSLAEAYQFAGQPWKAESCWLKARDLAPDNDHLKQAIVRIRGVLQDYERETAVEVSTTPGQTTGLRGPYLGQVPPGRTPEIFAPGIVSSHDNFEFSGTFSPDGQEFYFTRRAHGAQNNVIMVCRQKNGEWQAPEPVSFSGKYSDHEPHITPDGRRLYFGGNRPQAEGSAPEYGIFYVQREGADWNMPVYDGPGMYVSVSEQGNMYLTDVGINAGGGTLRIPLTEGKRGKPVRLGGGVNEPTPAAHAFIARDESFIIFDATRPDGQGGEGDYYVSFRQPDGVWGPAINLGAEINTPGSNLCPFLSPDGKYLFYTSYRDIYWVSTEILEDLRSAAK